MRTVSLDDVLVKRAGTVDPSKCPDEKFDLYSIPAYDRGEPELVAGSEIGSAKQIVQPGDVLLSRIVPHIRRAWVVGKESGRRIIASGEWMVFRSADVYPTWLRHMFLGDRFHQQFMATVAGVGGSLMRARPAHVATIDVSLPPLPEQRRIAGILDHAEAVRAKRRQVIAHLDDLAQAIFVDMFGDPIRNPHGYPLIPLGDVGVLDRGVSRHRPRNDPALLDGPYPLIQTGDVARSGGRITTYSATYSELGLEQSKLWPAGTLCITIAANIAETGVLAFDACFPDSVVGFTADAATTSYVRVWLSFLQATLEASAPQSAQRNINLAILRGLPVPLPDSPVLCRFQKALNAGEMHGELVSTASSELDALFASLQSRAFRGEL